MTLSIVALVMAAAPCPQADVEGLLAAWAQQPRIVGTVGYDRAIAAVETELAGRGGSLTRSTLTVVRAIPTRSDVLLFEDSVSTSAFAGLRERWRPDRSRPAARPAAFDWNPEAADARGPVVDLGAGRPGDFERVAGLGVSLEGAVLLVALPRLQGERAIGVRSIAALAAEARAVGVLVAPAAPLEGVANDFVLEDTRRTGSGPLAVPVIPVRSLEARAIRTRLRAKRVRGPDGEGVTVKLGPGPVEARVLLECPRAQVEDVPVLTWSRAPGGVRDIDRALSSGLEVPFDEAPDALAGGSARIATALRAIARTDFGMALSGAPALIVFGPTEGLTSATGGPPSRAHPSALLSQPPGSSWQPGAASSIAALHGESLVQLQRRLGGELSERLGAAAAVIAYSLRLAPADDAGLAAALTTLRRPVPDGTPR